MDAWQPRQLVTASAWSSHPPATTYFQSLVLQNALAFKSIFVPKSISIAAPAGTSSGTTQTFRHGYTHYVSLFSRKNLGNSSLSLTYMTHGSLVVTFSFTHNSTSMGGTMWYNTDSAGGTSSTNTTSNATANLAAYFNNARIAKIPFPATTLSAGKYWVAQAHSSSGANTAGTATTCALYSNLHIAPQVVANMGLFASTNTTNSSVGFGWPTPQGVASAITSNADMNMSVISNGTVNDWYIQFVNFP
jgi:hypothetical protein